MNKTILILIGISCAVITAGGIMRYRNFASPEIIAARQQLHNEDAEIRIAAIESLCKLGDKASAPEIRKLLNDNDKVACPAVIALQALGDKASVPEIRKLLKNKDSYARFFAINAMRYFDSTESAPEIRELLKDKDSNHVDAVPAACGFNLRKLFSFLFANFFSQAN